MNFGASWGDYDRDGDLDVYICNYFIENAPPIFTNTNHLFRNNGDGTFSDVSVSAGLGNTIELSLQSAWIDYNYDLWPDLYVCNDKIFQNRLYRNNGNGTFTDVSSATNTGIIIDSMSATFGDFNKDGLIDYYSTNLPSGNVLLQANPDYTFTDVTAEYNLEVNAFTWGAVWFDTDNDADLDMYIAESRQIDLNNPNFLYRYDDDGQGGIYTDATLTYLPDDFTDAYAAASGDLNNDYNVDLLVQNRSPYEPSVWLNTDTLNGNNAIKVHLHGIESNINGIGSWIYSYFGEDSYVCYTMCGEQYLSQNSFDEHIGIGASTMVDSVVVLWPSGIVDRFYSIPAFTTLTAVEGSSLLPEISFSYTPCSPGPGVLSLTGGSISSIEWFNGATEASANVFESGEYSVNIVLNSGQVVTFNPQVEMTPLPEIEIAVASPSCDDLSDGAITLTNLSGVSLESVVWNEGQYEGSSISGLSAGNYIFEATDENGCVVDGEANLIDPEPLSEDLELAPGVCPGDLGNATIAITGGTGDYTWVEGSSDMEDLTGGIYTYEVMDGNGCVLTGTFELYNPETWQVNVEVTSANDGSNGMAEIEVVGGTPPYTVIWSNGVIGLEATELPQGNYFAVVQDFNGCSYQVDFSVIDLSVGSLTDPIRIVSLGEGLYELEGYADGGYRVYDLRGRIVSQGAASLGVLDLRGLSSGVYVMELLGGGVIKLYHR
jgi:hypothetical protein